MSNRNTFLKLRDDACDVRFREMILNAGVFHTLEDWELE